MHSRTCKIYQSTCFSNLCSVVQRACVGLSRASLLWMEPWGTLKMCLMGSVSHNNRVFKREAQEVCDHASDTFAQACRKALQVDDLISLPMCPTMPGLDESSAAEAPHQRDAEPQASRCFQPSLIANRVANSALETFARGIHTVS